ncbi:hypothetical protein I79_006302 [Cricetulus griseus]|uniref:Uncharacterized protein n=1 Tax=Cricetulus griseus TaxID=10029 RepID=G3H7H1_CRIGR|nr:hypothetical protein I79_006302 [Cricetulus griseus]
MVALSAVPPRYWDKWWLTAILSRSSLFISSWPYEMFKVSLLVFSLVLELAG